MKNIIKRYVYRLGSIFSVPIVHSVSKKLDMNERVSQIALMQHYRYLKNTNQALPSISEVGFRKYSQFEEDGILLFLFSIITPINKMCVEICAGDGQECMSSNLIINHGWSGFLFDGNENSVRKGVRFFKQQKDTFLWPPKFTHAWINAENVNQVLINVGVKDEIDLLSLDLDGMDYWVWKAIEVISPRVVVCETHNPIPTDKSLTVPYNPNFVFKDENFRGASLAAMCKLGKEKGYRLVGTHRHGFNAFFIKHGIEEDYFPEIKVENCALDPFSINARKKRWPKVKNKGWEQV